MHDPKLKAAMKDIERICEKYDCAAVVSLTSKTHGEFRYILRDWLGVRLLPDGKDGAHRWHVKVHAKSNNEEAQLTCHWIYSTMDVIGNFFLGLVRGMEGRGGRRVSDLNNMLVFDRVLPHGDKNWEAFSAYVGPLVADRFKKFKSRFAEGQYVRVNVTVVTNYFPPPGATEEESQDEGIQS